MISFKMVSSTDNIEKLVKNFNRKECVIVAHFCAKSLSNHSNIELIEKWLLNEQDVKFLPMLFPSNEDIFYEENKALERLYTLNCLTGATFTVTSKRPVSDLKFAITNALNVGLNKTLILNYILTIKSQKVNKKFKNELISIIDFDILTKDDIELAILKINDENDINILSEKNGEFKINIMVGNENLPFSKMVDYIYNNLYLFRNWFH